MKTAVVVGNPKAKSRTLEAGVLVAKKLTGAEPDVVVDVVDLGAGLLGFGDPKVDAAIKDVLSCNVLIVASPTFKATYTGLLKIFLDQFPADSLNGITGFAVMLGAGPAHLLAPDWTLKPVLVELGATCPAVGLYLIDKTFAEDPRLDVWAERAQKQLPRP